MKTSAASGFKLQSQSSPRQDKNQTTFQAATHKLSLFEKTLLVRWINTLDVWSQLLTVQNILDEVKSGVLLCELIHCHQPKLDVLQGLNTKAVSRKACTNNIERALQVLFQKGAPTRVSKCD